jgi:hypothetical protein
MLELIYETHSITTDNEVGIATGWLVDAPFNWQEGWHYVVDP